MRVITVAQYLKSSTTSSYSLDDRNSITEFIDRGSISSNITTNNISTNDYDDLNEALLFNLNFSQSETITYDECELCSLYYLGGYIISSVQKCQATCKTCISFLICNTVLEQINAKVARLTTIKQYKDNCLVYCSQLAFDLFIISETVFRQFQACLLQNKCNIQQLLYRTIINSSMDISVPQCHNIKEKIINRFLFIRLHFFARKQKMLRIQGNK